MLYGADTLWWLFRKGVSEFKGIKVCASEGACIEYRDVHRVTVDMTKDSILTAKPGLIGYGKNSGFQATNLAVQFGAARIVWVGFDMRIDRGHHWHGRHGGRLNNPNDINIMNWRRALEGVAPQLAALGVEMLNASPVSSLTAYRKVDFRECLSASPSSATAHRPRAAAGAP